MAKKQYLDLTGLTTYDTEIKKIISAGDSSTLTNAKDYTDEQVEALVGGDFAVSNAEHAETADEATHAASADTATSATKATQDGNGKVISATYETKADATSKLTEAKGYTDTEIGKITAGTTVAGKATKDGSGNTITSTYETKSDATAKLTEAKNYTDGKIANLLDNSTEAVDSIMELAAAMEDNADAIEALQGIAAGKADATHSHAISDVTNLQSTLNAKAAQTSLDSHTGNGDIHVTAALKSNWNTAYTHSQAAHAPAGAQANVIETIKVNGTALTPSSKAVNITVPTDYLVAADIANKADKSTTLSGYGITNAYTKTEVDNKLSAKANQTSLDSVSTVANEAKTASASNTTAIGANTSSINTHTSQITALQGLVGDGTEAIPTASITALFA